MVIYRMHATYCMALGYARMMFDATSRMLRLCRQHVMCTLKLHKACAFDARQR